MMDVNSIIKNGDCVKFYRIGRSIGTGGFSVVRMANNRESNEKVAIKFISKSSLNSNTQMSLESEIRFLYMLRHPNIVQLYEVINSPLHVCFVMELMEGGELFDRIASRERYSEEEAKDAVRQILTAVLYCHSKDIVHRDIKPENLLYKSSADDATLKLADFGLAVLIKPNEMVNMVCGTPQYVAPEVITADQGRGYGRSADMWSVGVITYLLLSGSSPFNDENMHKLFGQIVAAKYNFSGVAFADVSPIAKDFISRLLEVDITKRLSAVAALDHPWISVRTIESKNLEATKKNLEEFNARRRLKGIFHAVTAAMRLKRDSSPRRPPALSTQTTTIAASDIVRRVTPSLTVKTGLSSPMGPSDISPGTGINTASTRVHGSMKAFPASPDTPDIHSMPIPSHEGPYSTVMEMSPIVVSQVKTSRAFIPREPSLSTPSADGKLSTADTLLRQSSSEFQSPSELKYGIKYQESEQYDTAIPQRSSGVPYIRKSQSEGFNDETSILRRLSSSAIPSIPQDMGVATSPTPSVPSNIIASIIADSSPLDYSTSISSIKKSASGTLRPSSAKMESPRTSQYFQIPKSVTSPRYSFKEDSFSPSSESTGSSIDISGARSPLVGSRLSTDSILPAVRRSSKDSNIGLSLDNKIISNDSSTDPKPVECDSLDVSRSFLSNDNPASRSLKLSQPGPTNPTNETIPVTSPGKESGLSSGKATPKDPRRKESIDKDL